MRFHSWTQTNVGLFSVLLKVGPLRDWIETRRSSRERAEFTRPRTTLTFQKTFWINTSMGVKRTSRLSLPTRRKKRSSTRIPTCLPKSANLFNAENDGTMSCEACLLILQIGNVIDPILRVLNHLREHQSKHAEVSLARNKIERCGRSRTDETPYIASCSLKRSIKCRCSSTWRLHWRSN